MHCGLRTWRSVFIVLIFVLSARMGMAVDFASIQAAYLKAGNTGVSDGFGYSIAVSGDIVVIGAPFEDSSTTGVNPTPNEDATNSGAAYIFVRNGDIWTQEAFLKASNAGPNDLFGFSVAISGTTVIIGAPIESSSTSGVDTIPNELAGASGAAYIFVRNGTTWTQQAYLKASNTSGGDQFGKSVAISFETVVVGAFSEDSSTTGVNSIPNDFANSAGAAYVFVRNGSEWTQQAYLKAGNTSPDDEFGAAVAISGDSIVVGVSKEDSNSTSVNSIPTESATNAGAAYVFVRNGNEWTQQAYLKASNTGVNDRFGGAVAISADTVVVGAMLEDSSTTGINGVSNELAGDSGAAYTFVRTGATWTQQAFLKASNAGAGDEFGNSVAVSGETVVVGAFMEDSSTSGLVSTPDELAAGSGAGYVFIRTEDGWVQQVYVKAKNTGAGDGFGKSATVSGSTVIFGAHVEASSTTGVDSVPDELAAEAGAAYIYTGLGIAPEIEVDPSTAFGMITLGNSSPPQTFTIRNLGNGPLAVSYVSVAGGNLSDYSVDTTATASTVPPGGSTTFRVTFTPVASGIRNSTVRILNNDSTEAILDLSLSGVCNAPPVISKPTAPVVVEASSAGGVMVSFAVVGSDVEDGALPVTSVPPSGSLFPIGDTTVQLSATDSRATTTTASFIVRVVDRTPPSLAVPASFSIPLFAGSNAVATFQITAQDLVSGNITPTVSHPSGSIFPLGVTIVTVSATDGAGNTNQANFTVNVIAESQLERLTDDIAVSTTGKTLVYPLANDMDASGTALRITSVREPSVIIKGRALEIPAGYTGTFSYVVSNGSGIAIASVTVIAGTPLTTRTNRIGLLYDAGGDIIGWMSVIKTATGMATSSLRVGTLGEKLIFQLPSTGSVIVPTKVGPLTLSEDLGGRLSVSLAHSAGTFTGSLRPGQTTAVPAQYNVALASIDSGIPGGGFARILLKPLGNASIIGKLPDGRGFTAKSRLTDHGSFCLYQAISRTLPKAIIAGEFATANLPATDVTGELAWLMHLQVRGLHASGVETTLTANGSIHRRTMPLLSGSATLSLYGGHLASPLAAATTLTAGKPTLSPLFASWTPNLTKGMFSAKIKDLTRPKGVSASGIYLQKSHRIWGFFPGRTIGGSLDIAAP